MNDPIYDEAVVTARVTRPWRWFWAGALVALAVLALAVAFLAYDRPDLLLDFANLRYCG